MFLHSVLNSAVPMECRESAYADEDNSPQPVPKPRLPYSTSHIESCSVLPRVRQLPNGLGRGRGRMASQTIGATPGIAANQSVWKGVVIAYICLF